MARAVAAASGIDEPDGTESSIPAEERLRAQLYRLLSRLLVAPPDVALLTSLSGIAGDGTELGGAFGALSRAAAAITPAEVAEEYHDLFIGLACGELVPFGSYYLTGFLNEKPLAELRQALDELGVARRPEAKEPEDHIGALCEVMAGLIDGAFGAAQPLAVQRRFFEQHMARWAGRFFEDLEKAPSAVFYMAVGRIGWLFMSIEATAFAMDA
jgi:TorA maturation chaperone TorD